MVRADLEQTPPPDLKSVALAVADGDLGVDGADPRGNKASIMAGLRNMRERLAEVVGTVRQSAEACLPRAG